MIAHVKIDQARLKGFAERWKIAELSFFGSVLGDDFGPENDVDTLVRFLPTADWGLFDHVRMQKELGEVLGRNVHLVSRRAIESSDNWIRRRAVLETVEVIYAA